MAKIERCDVSVQYAETYPRPSEIEWKVVDGDILILHKNLGLVLVTGDEAQIYFNDKATDRDILIDVACIVLGRGVHSKVRIGAGDEKEFLRYQLTKGMDMEISSPASDGRGYDILRITF